MTAAASCRGYGCDGHDPDIQTWQSGPKTVTFGDIPDIFAEVDLLYGVTDGDQYSWAQFNSQ
ncbi:hypothetical protein [Streptomyces sp. CA-111067]|uniref:hypothetical protein n=1 Tax=Streptomyces sp. CA-111067 TaxID=3240046 RepID=UPI003D986B73